MQIFQYVKQRSYHYNDHTDHQNDIAWHDSKKKKFSQLTIRVKRIQTAKKL